MERQYPPRTLSDSDLLRRVAELVGQSRHAEAEIVAHIAEVDARRLFAREACPSMFAYCTEVLHFSEAEAYLRINAGRASREHPILLAMLADGRLHLSAIARLASHLTTTNRDAVLARAAHRSKRQIEELIAELAPQPDAPALIRKLPERAVQREAPSRAHGPTTIALLVPEPVGPSTTGATAAPAGASLASSPVDASATQPAQATHLSARRGTYEPTSPGRFKVQFTASAELRDKLERLQELMRDSDNHGDLATVIEQAITEKLERLEARRFGRAKRPRTRRTERQHGASSAPTPPQPDVFVPRFTTQAAESPSSRHIPAAVRRAVRERDGDRCCFTDGNGRRCSRRHNLQYHHRHPYGYGGGHTVENIGLACSAHNRLMAEIDYGGGAVSRGRSRPGVSELGGTPGSSGPQQ